MERITELTKNSISMILKHLLNFGPFPQHIGFIIDGNRRYAKENGLKPELGHKLGKGTIMKVFEWCRRLGVSQVTVYTFSVDNFQRSEEEINVLVKEIGKVLQYYIDKRAAGDNGFALNILGNFTMLDRKLLKIVAELERNNPPDPYFTINLCIAYNSTEDFKNAFQELQNCVQKGLIRGSYITETLISKLLSTSQSTEPDLILRTSGVHRLSDFMLWESCHSVLYFTELLWPEFGLWDLLLAIIHYQRNSVPAIRGKQEKERQGKANQRQLADNENEQAHLDDSQLEEKIRITQCLTYLAEKRTKFLENAFID